jgi:hypothetical protein
VCRLHCLQFGWSYDAARAHSGYDSSVGFYRGGRRKVASRARWVEEAGAAEVVDSKGKLWLTTGVTRVGKLYYNIEEVGYDS